MTILIVEDNPVNQKIVQAILKKNNMHFLVATDGEQAIEQLAVANVDVILMDCQMPKLDGYEATKRIREEELKSNSTRKKIIALTANAMSGDKEKCLSCGMDDFISKPFQSEQLIEKIQNCSR